MNSEFKPQNKLNTLTPIRPYPGGLLSKKLIEANQLQEVYRVSDKSQFSVVIINVMNLHDDQNIVTIWIAPVGKTPSEIDIIEPLMQMKAHGVLIRSNVVLSQGEAIYIQATERLATRIEGFENIIPM